MLRFILLYFSRSIYLDESDAERSWAPEKFLPESLFGILGKQPAVPLLQLNALSMAPNESRRHPHDQEQNLFHCMYSPLGK
jgi:hypothetical protein